MNHSANSRLHVLIVEDQVDTATSMATLLEVCGYSFAMAADGPSALALAQSRMPDVILLDIGLPGMDGYTLARLLRDQQLPKRPLLIAVTGYGQTEDRERSAAAGIDLHLVKPANPEQLSSVLRRFQQIIGD